MAASVLSSAFSRVRFWVTGQVFDPKRVANFLEPDARLRASKYGEARQTTVYNLGN
ncbi:hypothetical protein COLO4_29036 [Corchorus olitorius]|uniref:Uncharacterized protein n=1 Tax=Corchorus olitorius TaxID=93759 RepID=A0A1R3HGS9_9ROSI|nr:hypothetical protein COLO4_29036 [Corchorus olitorius]